MELCDICGKPESGTKISAAQVRTAVDSGFDPVALGLLPWADNREQAEKVFRLTVIESPTDWNLCTKCLAAIQPFLPREDSGVGRTSTQGESKPAGFTDDEVSAIFEKKMDERGWTPEMKAVVRGEFQKSLNEKKQEGCFIATAACGSAAAPSVITLRDFRDTVLTRHYLGRTIISGYISVAPPLAQLIAPSPTARWLVRTLLVVPLASLIRRRR